MGGRAEGLACADQGARTHIGASGICLLFLVVLPPLLKPQKGLSWDFKFLHGLLTNKNKYSGRKIKFGPPPPGPLGAIFSFF